MSGPQRQTDHGLILGLGDDDHTHYLNAARHAATSHSFVDHGSLAGLADDDHTHYHTDARHAALTHSFVDHGALSGLGDDDHTQYHTDGRAATWHTGLSGAHVTNGDTHDHSGGDGAQIDHGGLGGLGDDDHPQYLRSNTYDTYSGGTLSFVTPAGATIPGGGGYPIEVYQANSGADAYIAFHVAGDFAGYFGISGAINDLAVGGWSWGANTYRVYHRGNHGVVAYAESTADQTGIGAGTTDLTGLSAGSVYFASGHRYRVSGFVSDFQRTAGLATDDRHSLDIRNGGGGVWQRSFFTYFNNTAGFAGAQYVERIFWGWNGWDTPKLTHSRVAGGATISKRASANEPSWILVEDIGT